MLFSKRGSGVTRGSDDTGVIVLHVSTLGTIESATCAGLLVYYGIVVYIYEFATNFYLDAYILVVIHHFFEHVAVSNYAAYWLIREGCEK